jgi:acetate---CoA ligase (ADP-forming)
MWLRGYREFKGKLYSVQVDPAQIPGIEAMGIPNYASLMEIPDEIDYVMCAVPRQVAPRITADAAQKKVGAMAFFTSGFAETDEELGIRLQDHILDIARENDLLVIGPNCMGIYNPAVGIRQSGGQPNGPAGPVGFVSQSGTHAISFGTIGAASGIRISKSISMGNAIVLNAAHYIEYLTQDPDTKVIAMYMEGVKDGRHLFKALRRATAVKPVVIWKGGQTPAGQRATHSHTASMATPGAIWDAVIRQTGVIATDSVDETLDVCKALVHAKPSAGTRMALLAMTGGQSVSISDAFAKQGLDVPALSDASYARLAEFFNIIGGSYRNPFDMAGTIGQRGAVSEQDNLREILRIVEADPNIDAIAVEARGVMGGSPEQASRMVTALKEVQERTPKPVITIVHPGANEGSAAEGRQQFLEAGIASFHSFERAARAYFKAASYWRYRQGQA